MRKIITILLIGFISIGTFGFLKIEQETKSTSTMLGMILLKEANSLEIDEVVKELKKKWKLKINDTETGKETSILVINGYRIAIANMPVAIPGDEVKLAAQYNYLWKNGTKEAPKHKGHIILSILNAGKNSVQENLLYSKVAAAILNNSKSLGIYIGGRTLVLKKEFYLANVEVMSEQDLPLYNWIYFGLRKENGKQSVYTYGLVDFGKKEMEILNSENSLEELNIMMFNLAHYVIAYDVVLKDGETIGISAEQKLKITESKGKFIDGTTLKIKY